MQKAIALALHEAGQTDREIADAVSTSVNDIRWWRNGLGLLENLSSEAKARAEEERYTPPLSRSASPERHRGIDRVSETSTPRPAANVRLQTPIEAQREFATPVKPANDSPLWLGEGKSVPAYDDLEELVTTGLSISRQHSNAKKTTLSRFIN